MTKQWEKIAIDANASAAEVKQAAESLAIEINLDESILVDKKSILMNLRRRYSNLSVIHALDSIR